MSLSDYAAAITHWRTNPVGCVIDVFGAKPKKWQGVALRTLADPGTDRLAIRACHGPGKTALDAWAIIWFLLCFYPAKVPCTAPAKHQLSDKLWPECKKWLSASKSARFGIDLEQIFDWSAEKITLKAAPQLHFAVGRTASIRQTVSGPEAYGLQGFHDEHLLFVADEASGICDAVRNVMEGARSTGKVVKTLATGNPNTPAGWFFEAFSSELWKTMRIDYMNGGPGIDINWAHEMIREFGENSPFVRVRVMGQFPRGIEGALIALDDWTACLGKSKREEVLALHPRAKRVMGVDVAGSGGNQSIITYAKGNCALKVKRIHQHKQPDIAAEVISEIDRFEADIVVIDCDGGYGAGVCDIVEEYYADKRIKPDIIRWHGNGTPNDTTQFHNKRAEVAWAVKMAAESGTLSAHNDQRLIAQATQIKYKHKNLKGKNALLLEDKKEFMARMVRAGASDSRSPDELDSFFYALYPSLIGYSSAPCATVPVEEDRYSSRIIM